MADKAQSAVSNEEFAWRYAGVQKVLYAYIFSLIPNANDADDVMQETAAALWAKAGDYDPEQPFLNWALTFARFQSLKFRKYSARHRARTAALSDEAFQALASLSEIPGKADVRRQQALEQCLNSLADGDLQLVRQRYEAKVSIHQVAGNDERIAARLYKRLQRIRRSLGDCIRQQLGEERG